MSARKATASRRLRVLLATLATLALTASGLVLAAGTASAGTSYFPTARVSTGTGTGVDLKAGVYIADDGTPTFTKTWARSFGSPNHRVEFWVIDDTGDRVYLYNPNVGTGWWEDCLKGTNTNCPGFRGIALETRLYAYAVNLGSGVCRLYHLETSPRPEWQNFGAC